MQTLRELLQNRFCAENRTRLILILGIAGMVMILISGILPDQKKQEIPQQRAEGFEPAEADLYRQQLEERLTELLTEMDGVGQVKVMLTVSGSGEQIYAEEVKADKTNSGSKTQSELVITRNNGNETALLSESRFPTIQGAAILCSGGGHAAVQERVSRAVATVLGIPASRIYVGQGTAQTSS